VTAGTNVGTAYLEVVPSAKGFAGKLQSQVGGDMVKGGKAAGESYAKGFGGGLKKLVGVAAGFVAVDKITGFLKDANAEAREAQKVGALTTQVIKSTGGAANVTATEVGNLATSISNKIGVDDEAIQSGENLLLTFKNVRNEAGKGNAIFDQATKAAVDLAAGMAAASGGQLDLRSSTTLVGKALNDPIKGLTALSRVGVTFTQGQKDQIKKLVETGHRMKAQKIILRELRSEFGGAAASQATESDKASVAIGNLKEQIGTALLPVVDDLARFTSTKAVPAISEFITGMQDGTGAGGDFADMLKDARDIGKGVLKFFDSIPGPVKKYGLALVVAGIALNRVNTGLLVGRARLATWAAGLGPAGAAMTRTGQAAYVLRGAAANLAGAGGMIALAKSTHETSLAVGSLERIGGGLAAGFAVGGPVGAAIGGTAGLLWTLKDAFSTNAKAVKTSLPSYKDYETTLDGVRAATTKATREMVLQRLEQSGLLDATRRLGLTDRQAVEAVMGNTNARKRLAEAMRHARGLTDEQKTALEKEAGAVAKSRLAQLQHNVAIAGSREELRKAKKALKEFMDSPASKKVTIETAQAQASIAALSRGLREALGLTRDLNTAGSGGVGVLLTAPTTSKRGRRRAMGGPVSAGTPYIVGERRPELFVPSVSGRIEPRVPSGGVDSEQAYFRAFVRALAVSRSAVVPRNQLAAADFAGIA
jgi:hypothetical protein